MAIGDSDHWEDQHGQSKQWKSTPNANLSEVLRTLCGLFMYIQFTLGAALAIQINEYPRIYFGKV